MAKTSLSLRMEPHESHIIREALRLYDYILEWQLGNPSVPPPDFDFNFGIISNPSEVRMRINEILVEMGGEAPRIVQRPQPQVRPQQQYHQEVNVWRAFKQGYRASRTLRRGLKL